MPADPRAPRPDRALRAFALPVLALVLGSGLIAATVFSVAGVELGDDAPHLLRLVAHPFVLFGDYRAAGFWDTWGSFPPLLPLLFGLLVRPWTWLVPDFWAIRLGALSWSLVCLAAMGWLSGRRRHGAPETRRALLAFAFLPTTLATISVLPQEETYVSLFVLALVEAARTRRDRWLLPLLVLAMLAGKYFLLILVFPLAIHSGAPAQRITRWLPVLVGLLGAYVASHWLLHGLTPILSHTLDPSASVSVWALLWTLGLEVPPAVIKALSIVGSVGVVSALCVRMKSDGAGLDSMVVVSLLATLLCISITFPGYVMWVLPLALVTGLSLPVRTQWQQVALFALWGAAELTANFSRGVALALHTPRSAGKSAVAEAAAAVLGADFPYGAVQILGIVGVLACGGLLIRLHMRPGPGTAPTTR
ncbi:MAG: hypothetical protein KDA24_18235 [Deltaproteobacteria bacterium]|nr:hypothetical protein [Deltaproteobacteria bacterium]